MKKIIISTKFNLEDLATEANPINRRWSSSLKSTSVIYKIFVI